MQQFWERTRPGPGKGKWNIPARHGIDGAMPSITQVKKRTTYAQKRTRQVCLAPLPRPKSRGRLDRVYGLRW